MWDEEEEDDLAGYWKTVKSWQELKKKKGCGVKENTFQLSTHMRWKLC
jgi:hypothetical protein